MSVRHDFECLAHGVFEARVQPGVTPRCPRGCSASFVKLVFLEPPKIASERVRTASRLVREMADIQGLADIDISPSRPGNSVADRNFKKLHPDQRARTASFSDYMGGLNHHANELTRAGFGHPYNPHEWMQDQKTGVRRHVAAAPLEDLPRVPTEFTRVRGKP